MCELSYCPPGLLNLNRKRERAYPDMPLGRCRRRRPTAVRQLTRSGSGVGCARPYGGPVMIRGTTSEKPHARGLLALLALCITGCAQLAGTSDYELAEEPPKQAPPTPFLLGSTGCEACGAAKCSEQLAICAANDVCSTWLADIRKRPDPLSAYERYKTEIDLVWQADHEGQPYDASITDLRECAQECLDVCPIGQNFSCVGDFEWGLPRVESLKTRVTLYGLPARTEIRACLIADQCSDPLDSRQTDEAGFAAFRLEPGSDEINYLRFATEGSASWQWVQTRPFADDDYIPLDLIPDAQFETWLQDLGRSLDVGKGLLLGIPVDCAGVNAKQVSLEAWYYTGGRLKFCEDCFYAYAEDATLLPNPERQAFETTGRAGFIANVNPGLVYVVLRRAVEPRDVVSVARVVVRASEIGTIRLYPASKDELASFPDPRN